MRTNTKTFWFAICISTVYLLSLSSFALADWTTPVPVTAVNTSNSEITPFLSNDKLTLYFSRFQINGSPTSANIYAVKRNSPSDPFSSATQVLNASGVYSPWVSPDNLKMYYTKQYYDGWGTVWGIKCSQRATVNDTWAEGAWESELNTSSYVSFPTMTADELTVMFNVSVSEPGNSTYDLYTANRANKNSSFSNIRKVTELCSSYNDTTPSLSADGLTVVFASNRGNHITDSLYMATRQSLSDPFSNIEHLSMFDFPGGNPGFPSLSADGKELYYMKSTNGGDIYVSYNVPEPATIVLLCIGGVLLRRSKR